MLVVLLSDGGGGDGERPPQAPQNSVLKVLA